MDAGFDLRRLATNHVFVAVWTYFLFAGSDPLASLDGGVTVGTGAILALWAVAVLGLLAIDALVAVRTLRGSGASAASGDGDRT